MAPPFTFVVNDDQTTDEEVIQQPQKQGQTALKAKETPSTTAKQHRSERDDSNTMGLAATPSTQASSAGGAKQDEMHSSKKRRQSEDVRAAASPSPSTSQSSHHQKPPLSPNPSSSKKRRMAEAKPPPPPPPPPPLDSNNNSVAVALAAAAARAFPPRPAAAAASPSTSTSQSAHHQKPPLDPNASSSPNQSSSKKRRMAEAKPPPPPPLDSNNNSVAVALAASAAAAAASTSASVFETTSSSNAPIPGAPWNAPIPGAPWNAPIPGAPWNAPIPGAPPTSSNVMHGPLPQPPGESSNHDTKMPALRATPPLQAPPKSFPTLISEVQVKSLVEHGFKPLKFYEVTIRRNMTNADTLKLQDFITNKVAEGDFALSDGTNSELVFKHERKDERNDVRIFKIEVENKSGNGGIRKMKDCGILVADDLELQQALVAQQFDKAQEQRMVSQSGARRSLPHPISWNDLNKSIRDNFCVQNFPSTGSSERMLALKETYKGLAKIEQAGIDSSPRRVVEQGRYITHLQQSLTKQQDITVAVLQQRARGGNVSSISSPSLAARCDSVPSPFNPNDHLLDPHYAAGGNGENTHDSLASAGFGGIGQQQQQPSSATATFGGTTTAGSSTASAPDVARNLHLGFGAPTSTGIDGLQQQQQQQQPPYVGTLFGCTTTAGSSASSLLDAARNSSASAGFDMQQQPRSLFGASPGGTVTTGPAASVSVAAPHNGHFGLHNPALASFGMQQPQPSPSPSSYGASLGGAATNGGAAGSFGGAAHATMAFNNSQFGPSTSSISFGSNAAAGGAAGSFGVAQQPVHVGQQPQPQPQHQSQNNQSGVQDMEQD